MQGYCVCSIITGKIMIIIPISFKDKPLATKHPT